MPDTFCIYTYATQRTIKLPIAWLRLFYSSAVLAHSPLVKRLALCRGDGGCCSPSLVSTFLQSPAIEFSLTTDAIAVGCLSMQVCLIVGRSLLLGEASFASGRVHSSVALAHFLFWMQRSSVVGRLNVCLPAVAMMVVNGAAVVRADSIVRYATSRRLLFCLVFFESRCRSHLFFRCEFSVMLRCPLSIL